MLPSQPCSQLAECVPRDAIQNHTCQFRTSGNNNNDNNNNNNNKQMALDEANSGINNLLALIPAKNLAPTAVTHELGSFSAVVS